jgi:glutamine synthetase
LWDLLVQRAAEHHVEFLEPAADGEQRHARLQSVPGYRQRKCVAVRIAKCVGIVGLPAVMVRFQVARAACQQDPVDLVHQLVDREVVREYRDDQRDRVGGLDNGFQVFFARHVEWMGLENATIRRHANNRFRAHMGTNPGTPLRLKGYRIR